MTGLLEVIALHADDARRAEAGGADRVEVVGTMENDGLSPTPDVVAQIRAATSIEVRVMLRLREGFGTDGGEFTRLRGLAASYVDAGADGLVLGFLNGHGEVDLEVCGALVADGEWPWTFHRAVDSAFDTDRAWRALRTLPRLDQVLTAGSARDVDHGLDDLVARAKASPQEAGLVMAGGGLLPEHVPWLARSGVRAFHIGSSARPQRSWKAYVDSDLVGSWRSLVDAVAR
ncbi:copper homeostasis protein CutC [Mariniluteicoccus flavus]